MASLRSPSPVSGIRQIPNQRRHLLLRAQPQYREAFAADLKKMLPPPPVARRRAHVLKFSKAGRSLADLHLNYENIPRLPGVLELHEPLTIAGALKQANAAELQYIDYRVEKMRFPSKSDKSRILYNSRKKISLFHHRKRFNFTEAEQHYIKASVVFPSFNNFLAIADFYYGLNKFHNAIT